MKETGTEQIALKAGTRAIRYEEKLKMQESNTIRGECWRKIQLEIMEVKSNENKKEFLKERGWSRRMESGEPVWIELLQIGKDVQRQIRRAAEIEESKYAKAVKELQKEGQEQPMYMREGRKARKQLETLARFRLGCEARSNNYWLSEEDRKCRICGNEEETIKERDWKQAVSDDGRHLNILKQILWK